MDLLLIWAGDAICHYTSVRNRKKKSTTSGNCQNIYLNLGQGLWKRKGSSRCYETIIIIAAEVTYINNNKSNAETKGELTLYHEAKEVQKLYPLCS